MNLMDILRPYAERATSTESDFDEVAPQVPVDVLGAGLADTFRAEQTPPFESMVGQLFGGSNPQLRAGLLNQLVRSVGPAVLASLAGGVFGRQAQARGGAGVPELTLQDVEQLSPDQVRDLAAQAQQKDPGIVDRVGELYARNPEVVKILGGAALAVALGQVAQRMRR